VFLVRKELKVKYKNSVLGLLWSLLNPLLTLLIYVVVFQLILGSGIPDFALFLFSGLLVFNIFQNGVLGGTGSVVDNAGIVKKVAFPREILPLASVGTNLMFFVFQVVVMVIFLVAFRHAPAWSELWLVVPALAAAVVFSAALAVFLSAVTVYLRDIKHLVEVLMTLWFWSVPVVYGYGTIAGKLASHRIPTFVYLLNPLVAPVLSFQRSLYDIVAYTSKGSTTVTHLLPTRGALWFFGADLAVLAVSAAFFLVALAVFVRLEGNFAEEL
jgi:ABC-2 type transport system permease protein